MSANKLNQLHHAIASLPDMCGPALRMENLVDPILDALPVLLQSPEAWSSIYIDYEPPYLMRIALPVVDPNSSKSVHIALHYFFGSPGTGAAEIAGLANPYEGNSALIDQESANNYHPHPWAAAFHLFEGSYRQRIGLATEVGYSSDAQSPLRPAPHDEWLQDSAKADQARYAFNDKLIWHQVLPNNGTPVASLMVTYIPKDWDQTGPRPEKKQRALTQQECDFMFAHFKRLLSAQPEALPRPKQRHAP